MPGEHRGGRGLADWRRVWQLNENEDLRRARTSPHVLKPGDRVFLPERETGQEECATEKRHRFRCKRPGVMIRLIVRGPDHRELADRDYRLTVDGLDYRGKTGSDGLVEKRIPAGARVGQLTVWHRAGDAECVGRWDLKIGELDPVDELSGVQARLNNLGFACGTPDGEMNPRTRAALRRFQTRFGLNVTGDPDGATRRALREKHAST